MVLAVLSLLSFFVVVGCAGSASKATDAGAMGGAAGAMGGSAGAPASVLTGIPFTGFDAAIPMCTNPPRAADAGTIPERDCGAGPSVSFQNDIRPLLASRCTGEICHESTWAGSKTEYTDLVNTPTPECCDGRKRIDPVHPDRSYLLEKLRGVDLCAGRRMPLSGSVTEAQISEIARWVCEGAPND